MIRSCTHLAFILIAAAFLASFPTLGRAEDIPKDIPWKIDRLTAQRLVLQAYPYRFLPSDSYVYDHFDPPFFIFALIDRRMRIVAIQNWFAVNAWTGEVWELAGCYKLVTRAAHLSQLEIRRRFTKKELKRYDELSAFVPFCIFDDTELDTDGDK